MKNINWEIPMILGSIVVCTAFLLAAVFGCIYIDSKLKLECLSLVKDKPTPEIVLLCK